MLRKIVLLLLLLATSVSAQHLGQDSLIARVRQQTRIVGDTTVASNTIIAHFLVWQWRPWFPGPEGYAALTDSVNAVAHSVITRFS